MLIMPTSGIHSKSSMQQLGICHEILGCKGNSSVAIRQKANKVGRRHSLKLLAASRSSPASPEFHVAPMRDYTDRHLRHLFRLLTSRAVLWSEMEKASVILERSGRGRSKDLERLLQRGMDHGIEVLQARQDSHLP